MADTSPAQVPSDSRWRGGTLWAAIAAALCLAAVAAAGVRITGELTRAADPGELSRASALELGRRWQTWPAGRVFPAEVGYTLEVGGKETARQVGIGAAVTCDTGLSPEAAAVAVRYGCRAVLRASYLDQSQGAAMTIGVVAFSDERSAALAKGGLRSRNGRAQLRALAFPNSPVAAFTDAAVQNTAAAAQRGPYLAFTVIGYADGRPAPRDPKAGLLPDVAGELAKAVLGPLGTPARVDCARPDWSC